MQGSQISSEVRSDFKSADSIYFSVYCLQFSCLISVSVLHLQNWWCKHWNIRIFYELGHTHTCQQPFKHPGASEGRPPSICMNTNCLNEPQTQHQTHKQRQKDNSWVTESLQSSLQNTMKTIVSIVFCLIKTIFVLKKGLSRRYNAVISGVFPSALPLSTQWWMTMLFTSCMCGCWKDEGHKCKYWRW